VTGIVPESDATKRVIHVVSSLEVGGAVYD
jgi:hypothetical protein